MPRKPEPATVGQSPLIDLALAKRRRWEVELAACDLPAMGLGPDALPAQVAEAGRRMTARIALAMLQEQVLSIDGWNQDGASVQIARPNGEKAALLVRGLRPDSPVLFPQLRLFGLVADATPAPIEDPIELLEFVAPAVRGAAPRDLARFADELTDGQLNDALACAYRAAWNERLRKSLRAAGGPSFWGWLKDRPELSEQTVMLEQWSAVGHPYHPNHKTRLGMSPAEVLSFCPEFEPQVQVGLVAARRERVRSETLRGMPPAETWLGRHFPAQAETWKDAMIEQGHDPSDFVAIPVHPWQARHEIPKRFSRSLAKGDLFLLAAPTIPSAPMVSTRTQAPTTSPAAPHLKLSLGVRLTSMVRTISPRSCEMGPRISQLLQDLISRDTALASHLRIQPEELGLYFSSSDAAELEDARFLSALLRRSPYRSCEADDFVIPTTAVTAASPATGAPLFLEITEAGADTDPTAVRQRFAVYAEALLRPLLTLYLRYGIGLEAHMQNTLALYSRSGKLQRFLFRDFGGIRIHEPSLRAAGFDLKVHPDRLTVVDDRKSVRGRLTAHALHRHLGYFISRICRHLQLSERPFWSDVADVVQTILDELRGDVAADTWRQDRAALLDDDWEFKANLRMRLENLPQDAYVQSRNPLRRDSTP